MKDGSPSAAESAPAHSPRHPRGLHAGSSGSVHTGSGPRPGRRPQGGHLGPGSWCDQQGGEPSQEKGPPIRSPGGWLTRPRGQNAPAWPRAWGACCWGPQCPRIEQGRVGSPTLFPRALSHTSLFLGPFPGAWAAWSSSSFLAHERAWLREQVHGVGGAKHWGGLAPPPQAGLGWREGEARDVWHQAARTARTSGGWGGCLPPATRAAVRAVTVGAPSTAQAPPPHPAGPRSPLSSARRLGRSCPAVAPGVALGHISS